MKKKTKRLKRLLHSGKGKECRRQQEKKRGRKSSLSQRVGSNSDGGVDDEDPHSPLPEKE